MSDIHRPHERDDVLLTICDAAGVVRRRPRLIVEPNWHVRSADDYPLVPVVAPERPAQAFSPPTLPTDPAAPLAAPEVAS